MAAAETLRDFIKVLEENNEVVHVKKEVDWDMEIGAIGRRNYEQEGPALWFENVKDYPDFSIFNGSVGTWKRVALALGLPADTSVREIWRVYEERIRERVQPVTVEKSDAPCKQNVFIGDQVDVNKLPAPMIHEGDGGRYLGTWDIIINGSDDGKWTNWGMYRFMIHNKNMMVGWPQTTSQFAMIMENDYLPKNKNMPVAIVIGCDPVCHMVATAPVKPEDNEAAVAGALRQSPVRLVKCETSDLMVPADAEIVIEGEILADRTAPDGPFGEYPGYRSGTMAEGVAMRVTAITYRNNPILTMISLGTPPDDSSVSAALTAGVAMKLGMERHGIPFSELYVPPEGVTHLIVVSVKEGGNEVTKQIMDHLTRRRVMASKVIVVDDDVDVFNMKAVIHAFATKCHPLRGSFINHHPGRANALTPCYNADERRDLNGHFAAFDATWPQEWPKENIPPRSAFADIYGKEIQEKVKANWAEYGLGGK
jgi:4-hydroxy-3-polyprenylbenzoate decarboxylase